VRKSRDRERLRRRPRDLRPKAVRGESFGRPRAFPRQRHEARRS